MAEESYIIKYDDEMLNEIPEMTDILGELTSCQAYVQKLLADLDAAYEGEATDNLQEFYTALNAHLTSLQMFYSVAMEHMLNCYLEMNGLDQAEAERILNG